jgi:RHS repeat-associated protein
VPPANTTTERWTGKWSKKLDTTTNLIEMGARPYDPALGRFLSVDPVDGGSLNNYEYAGQDPVNAYDLDGRFLDRFRQYVRGFKTACEVTRACDVVRSVQQAARGVSREPARTVGSWYMIKFGMGVSALGVVIAGRVCGNLPDLESRAHCYSATGLIIANGGLITGAGACGLVHVYRAGSNKRPKKKKTDLCS